jgi:hypothetical protein
VFAHCTICSEVVPVYYMFRLGRTIIRYVYKLTYNLTFIHIPDDGSAEPKHVVYWHNFRTNGTVCKQIRTVVCQTVFIIIEICQVLVKPTNMKFNAKPPGGGDHVREGGREGGRDVARPIAALHRCFAKAPEAQQSRPVLQACACCTLTHKM